MVAVTNGNVNGLHQTAATVVVVGVKAHPDEGKQADHARQKHEFGHGRVVTPTNVAAFASKAVVVDAGFPGS